MLTNSSTRTPCTFTPLPCVSEATLINTDYHTTANSSNTCMKHTYCVIVLKVTVSPKGLMLHKV